MSAKFYVSVEGARQGQFKGEVGDKMLGVGFSYGVTIPFDNATGLINGPRQPTTRPGWTYPRRNLVRHGAQACS